MKSKRNSGTSQRLEKKTENQKSRRIAKPVGPDAVKANPAPQERFVRDLLVRGEAQKPNRRGKLPGKATHAITKEDKTGNVKVKRARFKYF